MTSSTRLSVARAWRGRRAAARPARGRCAPAPADAPAARLRRAARDAGAGAAGRGRQTCGGVRGSTRRNTLPSPGVLSTRDLAAEQPRQVARDRQAEPGAAELAVGGAVRLAERLEDQLLLLGGDADAGVAHRELHVAVGPAAAISSDTVPRSVNLIAFESRFLRICDRRCASVSIVAGRSGALIDAEQDLLARAPPARKSAQAVRPAR